MWGRYSEGEGMERGQTRSGYRTETSGAGPLSERDMGLAAFSHWI